jgi:hypothetical protein
MIFSIQRYLEDYFESRGLMDNDQYAVKLANLYATSRHGASKSAFLKRLGRVQTIFFRANRSLARISFQLELLDALDRQFLKKKAHLRPSPSPFPAV